jgi:hypothetical protein
MPIANWQLRGREVLDLMIPLSAFQFTATCRSDCYSQSCNLLVGPTYLTTVVLAPRGVLALRGGKRGLVG